MKAILAALILCIGYLVWHKHAAHVEAATTAAITDEHGFMELDPPQGVNAREVVILAAQNCPREGAQRTDRLAREMAERGFHFRRASNATFSPSPTDDIDAFVRRHNAVMNGEVPIVFVNGRVKANPSVDDVVAEYVAATR
jgi:hypothetical protein